MLAIVKLAIKGIQYLFQRHFQAPQVNLLYYRYDSKISDWLDG